MGTKSNPRTMKTPRGQFLDHPDFHAKVQQLVKGGLAGTGKPYQAAAVAEQVIELLLGEMSEAGNTHAETVLTTLGALAGFAVQMAIREEFIKSGKISAEKAFNVITTKDGSIYYFGDILNEGLVTSRPGNNSVWTLVGGAAHKLGAKNLPDLKDLFGHVSRTVGGKDFGIPRLPAHNMPHRLPLELLDNFWNPVRNHLAVSVSSPAQWPLVLAYAAQLVIVRMKETINPGLAAQIVMESAIPMSKVDPVRVYGAYF